MANEKNLRIPSSSEAREMGQKGGKASGKSRRKKRTVAEAVRTACEKSISDVPGLEKLAKKVGLDSEDDVLSVVVQAIFLNEIKKGNFKSLKELTEILGEADSASTTEEKRQAELLAAIEKAVSKNGD